MQLLGLCLLLVGSSLAYKTYEGYTVLELTPETEDQLQFLLSLANDEQFALMYDLDFWKEPTTVGRSTHVMVSPDALSSVKALLQLADLHANIYIEDVSELIAEEYQGESDGEWTDSKNFNYDDYNTYEAILEELEALVEDCPGDFTCETYSIGQSVEGRELMVFKISHPLATRTAYWVDSVIHAREWIAVATTMKILNTLVREYETDYDARRLVDTYDWYFLPVLNADGYSYTWTDERLWRKNRGINAGSACMGTDLNRNYDYLWGGVGTGTTPCSATYGGSGPESEPETQVVVAEMNRIAGDLEAWISVHSYSQYWLNPWGDCAYNPDGDVMLRVSNAAADASEAAVGDTWDRGNWCEVLYPSTGILQDYAKDLGIPFTFTPELRDDGFGFVPPASSIQPSYDEIWGGLKALIQEIEAINAE